MKDVLFKTETIEKIKKWRKAFLWVAVWILIGELAFGAIQILTLSWSEEMGKIQATFLILAFALFVGVNNFIRMEKGDKKIQIFALISFVGNMIASLFMILLLWKALPAYWEEMSERSSYGYFSYGERHATFWSMLTSIATYSMWAGFWISNVMSIKETVKVVKPLKITAIVCVAYSWIFGTVVTITESGLDMLQLYALFGLAVLAFVVTTLAAWIISRTSGKKQVEGAGNVSSEAMESMMKEMVEKEVQERLAVERKKAEQAATPPLQSEDMPPAVSRDNEVKVGEVTGGNEIKTSEATRDSEVRISEVTTVEKERQE